MRTYVHAGASDEPQRGRLGARRALGAFAVPAALGFSLALVLKLKFLFLFGLVVGIVLAVAAYALTKALGGRSPIGMDERVLGAYQPILGRLSSAGFESAADAARVIIKAALALRPAQPHIFAIVDEALHFLTGRLLVIAETKTIMGDERELKRRAERIQHRVQSLSSSDAPPQSASGGAEGAALVGELADIEGRLARLEALNLAALKITQDLNTVRNDCESALVERATGQDAERRAGELLREKLEREKRVATELAQLGL